MEAENLLRAQYRQQLDNIKTLERDINSTSVEKATAVRECEDYQTLLQLSREKATISSSRLDSLQIQLRLARDHVSRLAPRHSAFARLDTALLQEIFRWCYDARDVGRYVMDLDSFDYYAPSRKCMSTPFVLASVCKKWRIVAINQKELWSSIFLSTTRSLEAAKCVARRSHRSLEDSPRVYINVVLVINDDTDVADCLATFDSFSARVQSLEIMIKTSDMERIGETWNVLKGDLPCLQRLVISSPPELSRTSAPAGSSYFQARIPNSRQLSYVAVILAPSIKVKLQYASASPPLSMLRFLSLRAHEPLLLRILAACPCIETLHLFEGGRFNMHEQIAHCTLNRLTELRLMDAVSIRWFIYATRFIDTPQLSHLEIASDGNKPPHPCFDAPFFAARPNISTLGLWGAPNPISRDGWTKLRQLQHLELSNHAPTTALSLLASADPPLCLQLNTISILDESPEPTAVEPLIQLINRRRAAATQPNSSISRIRDVNLPSCWEHHKREIQQLLSS